MELKVTNIVIFRSNARGVIVGWGDKAAYLVGARFTNPINKWDNKGRYIGKSASNCDIIEVHDGSSVENPTVVFRSSFKVDELPLIWKAE